MQNFQVIKLILIVVLIPVGFLFADIDNLRFLGHNEQNPYHVMDVEVVGNRAYISNGIGSGLEVYDIADPTTITRIYTNGPAAWRCVAFGDTLLAMFCRRSGVVLYDISGGGNPVPLGQYDPPGALEALEGGVLIGDTLYVAAHQNGIYFIDVSNPAFPQKVGQLSLVTNAAWNIEAVDSFLYIANGRYGLAVVGLAGSPHITATLGLPGLANDIVIDGFTAVMSLGTAGLATINIANPHAPVLLDVIGTDGCVWGSGIINHLVIAGSWRIMELFDVSTPGNINRIGWDNTKTFAHGADIRSDSLIAVADWRGMSCYKIGADAGADIDIYPQVIDFGPVSATADTEVIVRNTGSSILNVTSTSTPAGISANPSIYSVPAGDSQIVIITATGSGTIYSTIVYNSNDPDESSKSQEVYKNNTLFPQVGSLAPDFTLLGSDNNSHTLSDYRGKVVFLEFGGAW